MLDLSGKWVLVTGAARGIGRLAALKMADCGCNLILHSRDVSHTASLEEELKAFCATPLRLILMIFHQFSRCSKRSTL